MKQDSRCQARERVREKRSFFTIVWVVRDCGGGWRSVIGSTRSNGGGGGTRRRNRESGCGVYTKLDQGQRKIEAGVN